MTLQTLHWNKPWMQLEFPASKQELAEQLTLELGSRHPLFNRWKMVIGKRLDNDDIAVQLKDESFAIVHLLWADGPDAQPEKYPTFQQYANAARMQQTLNQDGMQLLSHNVRPYASRSHNSITGSINRDKRGSSFDAYDAGAMASFSEYGFDSDAGGGCSNSSSGDSGASDGGSAGDGGGN